MTWYPVVAGVEDSPDSVPAAALAWRMAQAAGTACHLVHVMRELPRVPHPADERDVAAQATAAARERLVAALHEAAPAEVLDRLEIRRGNVTWELAAAVRHHGAGLLVLGGKHHAAPVRWLGGSTVHHAVRTIDVPLLVTAATRTEVARVLIATDLSAAARPTLEAAAQIAELLEADLRAVHVVEPFPPIPDVAVQLDEQDLLRTAEQELDRVVQGTLGETPVAQEVVSGVPSRAICEEAQAWEADLIVVGSHGKGWVDRVLLGSTTERLLNRLPTSVLVVPTGAGG
jgi:nucleotide-binding universal stress UspA family protein